MSLLDPIPNPSAPTHKSSAPASATPHWPLPTGPSPDLPPPTEKTSVSRALAQDRHALQTLHGDFRDKLPHIFNPPEEQLPQVLAELCDPETSLADVACIFDTTVHAISVWMTRPDIARQLTDHNNAAIVKARSAAACQLPKAVRALTNIVEEFNEECNRLLWNPRDHSHIHARIRSRDCARRAATLLTRLARLVPPTSTVPSRSRCESPAAPALREVLPPGGGVEPRLRGSTEGATAVLPPLQRLAVPTTPELLSVPLAPSEPLPAREVETEPDAHPSSPLPESAPSPPHLSASSPPHSLSASPRPPVSASSPNLTTHNSPLASPPSATGHSPLATGSTSPSRRLTDSPSHPPSPDTG